jgi:hypothetical protein
VTPHLSVGAQPPASPVSSPWGTCQALCISLCVSQLRATTANSTDFNTFIACNPGGRSLRCPWGKAAASEASPFGLKTPSSPVSCVPGSWSLLISTLSQWIGASHKIPFYLNHLRKTIFQIWSFCGALRVSTPAHQLWRTHFHPDTFHQL